MKLSYAEDLYFLEKYRSHSNKLLKQTTLWTFPYYFFSPTQKMNSEAPILSVFLVSTN